MSLMDQLWKALKDGESKETWVALAHAFNASKPDRQELLESGFFYDDEIFDSSIDEFKCFLQVLIEGDSSILSWSDPFGRNLLHLAANLGCSLVQRGSGGGGGRGGARAAAPSRERGGARDN